MIDKMKKSLLSLFKEWTIEETLQDNLYKYSKVKSLNRGDKFNVSISEKKSIIYIKSGQVRCLDENLSSEKIAAIDINEAQEFLCLTSLMENTIDDKIYEALIDSEILIIPSYIIQNIMDSTPSFRTLIMNQLISTNERNQFHLSLVHYSESVSNRLIRYLIWEAKKKGKLIGSEILIKPCLNHEQIADFIYTSRQTVSINLMELKKKGWIYYDREYILIHEYEKMAKI